MNNLRTVPEQKMSLKRHQNIMSTCGLKHLTVDQIFCSRALILFTTNKCGYHILLNTWSQKSTDAFDSLKGALHSF